MKYSLRLGLSSDVGYADSASPASSTASISETSETDPFLLGNVVEVKAVDELPEEISELLCHGDVSGLMQNGKDKKVLVKTSSSSPSDTSAVQPKYRGGRKKEAPPPNMTSEQRFQWEKMRQKKDNHNDIERRRRDKINECIRVLSLIVPNDDDEIEYNKKGAVLEAAVNYIKRLQSDQRQMEEYRRQQEILQQTNRSLMLEIQQLQNNAQLVHISSPHLGPPVQVQQVMLHQHQPQFEQPRSSLDQGTLPDTHRVELLMAPNHQNIPHPQIEMQQQQQQQQRQQLNPFMNKFVNFVPESSSECHPIADSGHFDDVQFKNISDIVFLDELRDNLGDLADHSAIDVVPDHADAISYSVDDFFGIQSVQLNGDPLLSNATDVPMVTDFDDLYNPLALL